MNRYIVVKLCLQGIKEILRISYRKDAVATLQQLLLKAQVLLK